MLDHVSIGVSNYEKSKEFYQKALAPLGIEIQKDFPDFKAVGFGSNGNAFVWVAEGEGTIGSQHIAFVADGPDMVKKFYDEALAAGGSDNGAPGPRPDYGDNYYAAFVLDPDGHNIEAVFRGVL